MIRLWHKDISINYVHRYRVILQTMPLRHFCQIIIWLSKVLLNFFFWELSSVTWSLDSSILYTYQVKWSQESLGKTCALQINVYIIYKDILCDIIRKTFLSNKNADMGGKSHRRSWSQRCYGWRFLPFPNVIVVPVF